LIFGLVISLSLFSCKSHKQAAAIPSTETNAAAGNEVPAIKGPEGSNLLGTIPYQNLAGFKFLKGKIKLDYTDKENSHKVTASLRMAEDSLIWLSLTPGLGIEVARLLFTRDSLFFVDKINKSYFRLSYSQAAYVVGAPVSFEYMQAVILGNTLALPVDSIAPDSGNGKGLQYRYFTFNNPEVIQLLSPKIQRPTELLITLLNPKTAVWVQFSEHTQVLNFSQPMPMHQEIVVEKLTNGEISKTTIGLHYHKIEPADASLAFPFEVPDGYRNMVRYE